MAIDPFCIVPMMAQQSRYSICLQSARRTAMPSGKKNQNGSRKLAKHCAKNRRTSTQKSERKKERTPVNFFSVGFRASSFSFVFLFFPFLSLLFPSPFHSSFCFLSFLVLPFVLALVILLVSYFAVMRPIKTSSAP